jgi:GH25 family lysozyme M1 (1,4-beta-N-acetylmuramidase)/murein DD-endopeptidase MepM/ murein hydrolase activator NlpD
MTYIWCVKDALLHAGQEYGSNPNKIQPGGHTGLDIKVPVGTPIYAEADGVIVFACWADDLGWPNAYYVATSAVLPNPRGGRGGAGIVVGLDVGPFLFIKAHLLRSDMNAGDRVKQGQLIGYSGDTGYTFGAHIHLDVLPDRWNVKSPDGRYGRVNPRSVIDGIAVAPAGSVTLKPNERMVGGSPVNQRSEPRVGDNIIRVIPPKTKEVFTGWVHGEEVNWNGQRNDIWLKDDKGYASVLFFDPTTTAGLPDLTPAPPPPPPVQPEPPVQPPPVPPVDPQLHGVDISNHQQDLDVSTLPGDFVIIKASEGVGYTSPAFTAQARAVPADKLRMFYHYARPNATGDNTAAAEATYFLEVVRPQLRQGDVLVLDWEDHAAGVGYAKNDVGATDWAVKFLRIVATATGSTPLLYTYVNMVNSHNWADVEDEFPLWLAGYSAGDKIIDGFKPDAAGSKLPVSWQAGFKMWQYTSHGRLPGYSGNLDLNVWYGTRADVLALGVTRIPSTPGQPPAERKPPTVDQPISALIDYYRQ